MTKVCPHCLEPIDWRQSLRARIPTLTASCARCGSKFLILRATRSNPLIVFGLLTCWALALVANFGVSSRRLNSAINTAAFGAAALSLYGCAGATRIQIVRAAGRFCHRCGYNLLSNKSGTCPECGNYAPVPIDWVQFHDPLSPTDAEPPKPNERESIPGIDGTSL